MPIPGANQFEAGYLFALIHVVRRSKLWHSLVWKQPFKSAGKVNRNYHIRTERQIFFTRICITSTNRKANIFSRFCSRYERWIFFSSVKENIIYHVDWPSVWCTNKNQILVSSGPSVIKGEVNTGLVLNSTRKKYFFNIEIVFSWPAVCLSFVGYYLPLLPPLPPTQSIAQQYRVVCLVL